MDDQQRAIRKHNREYRRRALKWNAWDRVLFVILLVGFIVLLCAFAYNAGHSVSSIQP